MAASFKERRDSLKNRRFKSVKLVSFVMGVPREENMYEVWYQPNTNMVSLYQSKNLNIPLMSMPYGIFLRPSYRMSDLRWPESVMNTAIASFKSLPKKEMQKIADFLPLNTFMLEGGPAHMAAGPTF